MSWYIGRFRILKQDAIQNKNNVSESMFIKYKKMQIIWRHLAYIELFFVDTNSPVVKKSKYIINTILN